MKQFILMFPLVLLGCSDDANTLPGDSSTGGAASSTTTGEPDPTTEPDPSTTSSEAETSTGGTSIEPDGSESTTCGFVCDDTSSAVECDIWAQDCPRGEKCNPWASDGGSTWNASRCVPIVPDPAGVDEPCTVEGSITSGLDTCAFGSMCWNFDQDGNGVCTPLCSGPARAPTCEDPTRICPISGSAFVPVCISTCDPLQPDACAPGFGCYPGNAWFVCTPDASGNQGGAFEPCEFVNGCDPGLICANPAGIAPCDAGSPGCCTAYCDLASPSCPPDTTCVALFEDGAAPTGLENVGFCGAPS